MSMLIMWLTIINCKRGVNKPTYKNIISNFASQKQEDWFLRKKFQILKVK